MLASRQGGMHGNEAGDDPWQPSREAGKASSACPGPPPPADLEEGAGTPPGSPSVGCFMAFPAVGLAGAGAADDASIRYYTASIPTTTKLSCLTMHTALYLARGVISSLVRLLKNLKC